MSSALQGAMEIMHEIQHIDQDFICCPVGSATTLAGLSAANEKQKTILGFAALKNAGYLKQTIQKIQHDTFQTTFPFKLLLEHHGGGFGKVSTEVAEFTKEFNTITGIPIEPIYTGKMFLGLWNRIESSQIPEESTIVAIHTGGLQGLDVLAYRNIFNLQKSHQND